VSPPNQSLSRAGWHISVLLVLSAPLGSEFPFSSYSESIHRSSRHCGSCGFFPKNPSICGNRSCDFQGGCAKRVEMSSSNLHAFCIRRRQMRQLPQCPRLLLNTQKEGKFSCLTSSLQSPIRNRNTSLPTHSNCRPKIQNKKRSSEQDPATLRSALPEKNTGNANLSELVSGAPGAAMWER
jgi:hypothetical protein